MPPPIFYVCSTVLRSLPNSPANTKFLKTPFEWGPPAQRDPRVVATVSKSAQHHRNRRTGRRSRLRGQDRSSYGAGGGTIRDGIRAAGERLTPQLRDALQIGPTKKSGQQTRSHLLDFQTELGPGLVAGHKYIPVQRVGGVTRATTTPQLADAVDAISSYEGHVQMFTHRMFAHRATANRAAPGRGLLDGERRRWIFRSGAPDCIVTHPGYGQYGKPSGRRVFVWGLSQLCFRHGGASFLSGVLNRRHALPF